MAVLPARRSFYDVVSQDKSGLTYYGDTVVSNLLQYRSQIGCQFYDEVIVSYRGEKVLRTMIGMERGKEECPSLVNLFINDDNAVNIIPALESTTKRDVTSSSYSFAGPISSKIRGKEALSRKENNRRSQQTSRHNREVISDILLHHGGKFKTYKGLFYGRETRVNIYFYQEDWNYLNYTNNLLLILIKEENLQMSIRYFNKGVSILLGKKSKADKKLNWKTIPETFSYDMSAYDSTGVMFPIDAESLIRANKQLFRGDKSELLFTKIVNAINSGHVRRDANYNGPIFSFKNLEILPKDNSLVKDRKEARNEPKEKVIATAVDDE